MNNTATKKLVKHNFGIALNSTGMAVCHSFWFGETLVISHLWIGKENGEYIPVSTSQFVHVLEGFIAEWDKTAKHDLDVFCCNGSIALQVQQWLVSCESICEWEVYSELLVKPCDAAPFLESLQNDEHLAITDGVDRNSVKTASQGISESELGRPTGQPESIAVLLGVAEPAHRRLSIPDAQAKIRQMRKEGRKLAAELRAMVG